MYTIIQKTPLRRDTIAYSSPQKFNVQKVQRRGYSLELSLSGGRASVSGAIVTVFGCTGFLGRYVVQQFGRVGSQVVVPYRGEEKGYNHLKVMGDLGQIIPTVWDIRDKDSIRNAVKYSNVIINLAGRKWDTRNFTMYDTHVEGARRIAEVAKEFKVERFIHVSALGATTTNDSEWLKTKAEGELAVKSVFPDVTIIRPAEMWGAEDSFLNNHASILKYWPAYPMMFPDKHIQPVWVNDVASAITNCLKTRQSIGRTYEVGGPSIITNREIIEWMNKVLKRRTPIIQASENVMWHLGYWLGQHRHPRYTMDSIKESSDVVCSNKYPGLKELGVKATSFTSPLCMSYIFHYRPPSHMLDITFDETEDETLLGKPAY